MVVWFDVPGLEDVWKQEGDFSLATSQLLWRYRRSLLNMTIMIERFVATWFVINCSTFTAQLIEIASRPSAMSKSGVTNQHHNEEVCCKDLRKHVCLVKTPKKSPTEMNPSLFQASLKSLFLCYSSKFTVFIHSEHFHQCLLQQRSIFSFIQPTVNSTCPNTRWLQVRD